MSQRVFSMFELCLKDTTGVFNIPDTLEMHGSNLDNVAHFFALENAISSTAGHTSYVQELRAVDHVVVCKRVLVGLSYSFSLSLSLALALFPSL